jgi:hypothetical protein
VEVTTTVEEDAATEVEVMEEEVDMKIEAGVDMRIEADKAEMIKAGEDSFSISSNVDYITERAAVRFVL